MDIFNSTALDGLLNNVTNNSISNKIDKDGSLNLNYVDTVWIMVSTALVLLMLTGLGIFYSGFVQTKNSLTIFMSTFLPGSMVGIQWLVFGYSLVFSSTGSKFIGNFDHVLLKDVGNKSNPIAPTIPSNVFMIYQCFFAVITPTIIFGSVAERATLSSFILITLLWSTLVYDILAYWTWNLNGWLHVLGSLDFAGGGPVHIASGFSSLAYALVVGPRAKKPKDPVNLKNIYIGTGLLWFGWLGFNGGSELALNSRSVNAVVTTNFCAFSCGICWIIIEMIVGQTKKISLNGFCSGIIAGLVAITPACGFVSPVYSILIGFITSICCFSGCYIKKIKILKLDDACDVFGIHAIGGIIGSILTGVFAQNSIVTMGGDAAIIGGAGFLDNNFYRVGFQLIALSVSALWSFVITIILVKLVDIIPFLQLRFNEAEQNIGADQIELGENAEEKNQTSTSNIPIGFKNNSFEMAINLRKSPKALKSKSAIYPSISMLKNDSQKRY